MRTFLVSLLVVPCFALSVVAPAAARVAGGGTKKTDCYSEFDGITPTKGSKVSCVDGDPACDSDGTCTGTCTFKITVCSHQTDIAACKSPNITGFKKNTLGLNLPPTPVTTPTCGPATMVTVNVKTRHGKKISGTRMGKLITISDGKPKSDTDTFTLECKPRTTGTCPTTTTTTTTSSTTTTTGICLPQPCPDPNACGPNGGASKITTVTDAGTLTVGTLPPFPFPQGVTTVINVGPADANCRHPAIVPATDGHGNAGFNVPVFCIPGLGFTSVVIPTNCTDMVNAGIGNGFVWDGNAPNPDADVIKKGDTSDGTCDTTPVGTCTTAGGVGGNSLGKITSQIGDGTCDQAGVHTALNIPVESITWIDKQPLGTVSCCTLNPVAGCQNGNGLIDPGEAIITDFFFILSPTTSHAVAKFEDMNGDGCSFAGSGPSGPVTLTGSPAPGPCCHVGDHTTVVAAGVAFTGGGPLYDLIFQNMSPATITACDAFDNTAPTTCTLSNDPCIN
jgi:hypothetical protein